MQYFVVGPDGSKYGPADLQLLRQWVTEGRIIANTLLEDLSTGQKVQAHAVPGLLDNAQTVQMPGGYQNPGFNQPYQPYQPQPYQQGYTPYPRYAAYQNPGSTWIILSWVFSSLGIICCSAFLFSVLGIVFAFVARSQGSKQWVGPLVLGCVGVGIGVVLLFLRLAIMSAAFGGGG